MLWKKKTETKSVKDTNHKYKNVHVTALKFVICISIKLNNKMKVQKFENEILNCKVCCFVVDYTDVWFRAKDVATALGYNDTTHAIISNVEDEVKNKLEELLKERFLLLRPKFYLCK